MSYALDVNVLLYASDESCAFHEKAAAFLRTCVASREVFCLAWPTVMSYLRIATHGGIFKAPLTPARAMANVAGLFELPHLRLLSEREGFWDAYRTVTAEVPVRGNLVPDAHLAALLLQDGVPVLYTNDSDFRKFSFLDTRNPFV